MILLIFIAMAFYKYAKKNGLNTVLWTIVAIVAHFGGQFLIAFIAIFTFLDQRDITRGTDIVLGLIGSVIGLGIAYMLMVNAAKNKTKKKIFNDNLLDDDFLV